MNLGLMVVGGIVEFFIIGRVEVGDFWLNLLVMLCFTFIWLSFFNAIIGFKKSKNLLVAEENDSFLTECKYLKKLVVKNFIYDIFLFLGVQIILAFVLSKIIIPICTPTIPIVYVDLILAINVLFFCFPFFMLMTIKAKEKFTISIQQIIFIFLILGCETLFGLTIYELLVLILGKFLNAYGLSFLLTLNIAYNLFGVFKILSSCEDDQVFFVEVKNFIYEVFLFFIFSILIFLTMCSAFLLKMLPIYLIDLSKLEDLIFTFSFIYLCVISIPAYIAYRKGRNFKLWFIYAYPFFIIAMIHAIVIKPIPDKNNETIEEKTEQGERVHHFRRFTIRKLH